MPGRRALLTGARASLRTRLLRELRRLLSKAAAAGAYRAVTDDERLWCARVGDALEELIREGDRIQTVPVNSRKAGELPW